MPEAPLRLLLDMRETDILRGFHAVAAASLLIPRWGGTLPPLACTAITGDNPDEPLALDVLRYDTGLPVPLWGLAETARFDLFLIVADAWPDDDLTRRAISCATATLVGLTGSAPPTFPAGTVIGNGNDTAAIAETALRMLGAGR